MSVSNTSFFFHRLRLANEERKHQKGDPGLLMTLTVDETDDHVIIDESDGRKTKRLDFGVKSSFSWPNSIDLVCV